ncbi:MAG TPA: phosphate ABC transporter permease subunit PstC [Jatrophihabitantaceae bacterium]|nr:phosphate ABC transporter permease subunit PstC [Jatrophihabitantaceae bacterium]
MTTAVLPPVDPPLVDQPRFVDPGLPPSDKAFRHIARSIGIVVLALTGSIGLFLGYQSIPTLDRYGFAFFTQTQWEPARNTIGIAAVLLGTIQVALIALVIGFPIAFALALYVSEYAPAWARSTLVALIDLMAAVPSIIYGMWGARFLQPHAIYVSRWLHQNLGFIPLFHVDTNPNAATWEQSRYTTSAFIAGIAVAMMVIPLAAAVMRGVFAQAPIGEREAAYALGSTRWGMVRAVVIPFGRGGMIGGTMLALGRALGETIAVLLIISPAYEPKWSIIETGTQTISGLIASLFGEATKAQLSALLTAGFVLFVMTIIVNTIAAIFVTRSRSGAAVEI